jgi:hypothetical protein
VATAPPSSPSCAGVEDPSLFGLRRVGHTYHPGEASSAPVFGSRFQHKYLPCWRLTRDIFVSNHRRHRGGTKMGAWVLASGIVIVLCMVVIDIRATEYNSQGD